MKRKTRKRYLTANQIRDEIDKYKEKHRRFLEQAEGLELSADEFARTENGAEDAAYKREQAKKCRRSAQRIMEDRIPKLKQKLAEFATELLPGIITDGDRSIQA